MIGQQTRLLTQGRLPVTLQGAGHQPILWLDADATAAALVDLMARPFEPPTPNAGRALCARPSTAAAKLASIATGSSAIRISCAAHPRARPSASDRTARRRTCVCRGSCSAPRGPALLYEAVVRNPH